jgi:hypothetical protein
MTMTETSKEGAPKNLSNRIDDEKCRNQEESLSSIDAAKINQVTTDLNSKLTLTLPATKSPLLICDAGYGLPREVRPRKEKILAIARQLVNFLEWQLEDCKDRPLAQVKVVGCPDAATQSALENRTLALLKSSTLPSHVEFSCEPLEETCSGHQAIYLSPDTEDSLDLNQPPPSVVVVGLLIDRRIQPNRSMDRAINLELVAKRWPLEECFAEISANEPLNVDCVLEGMQQWWWNSDADASEESFIQAASQAIQHHAKRHPSRPMHVFK